jgi:hypothetical protein
MTVDMSPTAGSGARYRWQGIYSAGRTVPGFSALNRANVARDGTGSNGAGCLFGHDTSVAPSAFVLPDVQRLDQHEVQPAE